MVDPLFVDLQDVGAAQERALTLLRARLIRTMGAKLKAACQVDDTFVEDITQETLIVVLAKLGTFRGESAFFTWVCTVAVRLALAEIRKKRWQDYSLDALTAEEAFEPPAHGDFTEPIANVDALKTVKMSIMTALTEN